MEEEQKPTRLEKFKKVLQDNFLTLLLVGAIVVGAACGVAIRANVSGIGSREANYISFPGDLLIRIIKCSATPLIITCVIVALGSLKLSVSRTVCWQLIVLVVGTKILSSLVGLAMVCIINPGSYGSMPGGEKGEERKVVIEDIFMDLFRNIFTHNMVGMYIRQYQTEVEPPINQTTNDVNLWRIVATYISGMNILGIMCIGICVGVALSIMHEQGRPLLQVTYQVSQIAMKVATWIIWISPIFLFFLILGQILGIEDIQAFLHTWGFFLLTTHAGIFCVGFVEYPLLVFITTRENPFKLYKDVIKALITAYATASSLATMPYMIEGLIRHGLDERLVRFVVPVGTSINKDGATCFLVVSTIFVAQMFKTSLSVGHYFTILILASMGSIAAAGVPFSGIVVLVMILNGVGLDQTLVGGILAVELLNDRMCTLTNVIGNCCQPKMIAKWNKTLFDDDQPETIEPED